MNLKLNQPFSSFDGFKKCFRLAPLPVAALFYYLGLPSTRIFPDGTHSEELWHSAYLGWYDFFLAFSILLAITTGVIQLSIKDFLFLLALLLIVTLSFFSSLDLGNAYILDTLGYIFRFYLTFSLAKGLVQKLGTQTTESLLISLFILLAISALFVYQQRFGQFNRIYSAAMTAASFSQVSAVVCFIGILRKNQNVILMSLVFLLLTFSRTSILLLIVLLLIASRRLPVLTILKSYSLLLAIAGITIYLLLYFAGDTFMSVIADRTNPDDISTLNSRNEIWEHALYLLNSGYVPLFGVGFHATPNLIVNTNLSWTTSEGLVHFPPHFHSIFIEYAFGLGISSLFIFYFLVKRIWQTFSDHCYPSFFIFSFFLLCQAVDFTFYVPKEVIIWSLMLGIAEGQWRYERG